MEINLVIDRKLVNLPLDTTWKQITLFKLKIDKTPGFGPKGTCFKWRGSCIKNTARGKFTLHTNGKRQTWIAARFLWCLLKGKITKNLDVCHECDNAACMNINHFYLATQEVNLLHRDIRHRLPSKQEHHCYKNITPSKKHIIKTIRKIYNLGRRSRKFLAKKYNMSPSAIRNIGNNIAWKYL